jgi:hypothetical protein
VRNLMFQVLARSCATRPWLTIVIWVLVPAVFGLIAPTTLSSVLTTEINFTNHPESARASKSFEDRLTDPEKHRDDYYHLQHPDS